MSSTRFVTETNESMLQPSVLSEKDAALIKRVLLNGKETVARQRDLVDLHERLVAMFSTLQVGLGDAQQNKAKEDRRVLVEKIQEMDKSVNRMEGALTIELPPLLRKTVEEIIRSSPSSDAKPRANWPISLLLVVIGISLGAVFATEIRFALDVVTSLIAQILG